MKLSELSTTTQSINWIESIKQGLQPVLDYYNNLKTSHCLGHHSKGKLTLVLAFAIDQERQNTFLQKFGGKKYKVEPTEDLHWLFNHN